jgi:hypothetical protein
MPMQDQEVVAAIVAGDPDGIAEATVAAFAGRLRGSVDLASIQNELAAAVEAAVEPEHVSVWLA